MTDHEMLMEDRDAMEDAMSAIAQSACADLWQNQLIFRMCKAIFDLVKVVERLRNASADENRQGRWDRDEYGLYRCSECGYKYYWPEMKSSFCPGCGARMI